MTGRTDRAGVAALAAAGILLASGPASADSPPPARAAAKSYTIRAGTHYVRAIGAFRPFRHPTIAAAVRVFGRPSSRHLANGSCVVKWRRIRLRILFANFGGHAPGQTTCSNTVGRAQSFVAKGRRFRTWKGLRVGQSEATLRKLHPSARRRHHRWWLRTAVSPFGDGSRYAVVAARVGPRHRVTALEGWIGAAGE